MRLPSIIIIIVVPLFFTLFLASCAPKVTFHVTKPPELAMDQVDSISMGVFSELPQQKIALPGQAGNSQTKSRYSLVPRISKFASNKPGADLIRSMLAARLSAGDQYRIINTEPYDKDDISGLIPDATKTGVITARVKYFEKTIESSESTFYSLLATKQGGTFQEQLIALAAKESSSRIASSSKKGYKLQVPYIETIAAMEVEFDVKRDSTGEKIIPTQILRSYYVKKWGGSDKRSHVPEPLRQVIVTRYQKGSSFMESLISQAAKVQLAATDPDEFLAMGGKLKYHPSVSRNSLEIRARLSQQIVDQFAKLISPYTVETVLEVASGDSLGVTYIKGNAYELAINRLESIERSEKDSYNLALAYESIGEYRQAANYYQEALDLNPKDEVYQKAFNRVKR
jgi:tetratricopeptide (TPR) repeat protein